MSVTNSRIEKSQERTMGYKNQLVWHTYASYGRVNLKVNIVLSNNLIIISVWHIQAWTQKVKYNNTSILVSKYSNIK